MPKYILLFGIFAVILSLFLVPTSVFASPTNPSSFTISKGYYDSNSPIPPNLRDAPDCPKACNVVGECANSQNPNNCGIPYCDGGKAWTKYNIESCKFVDYNEELDRLECRALYTEDEQVYSIGDKCVSGEQGLRSSSCTNIQSPSMYKTCCTWGSPSFVNPGSCVDYAGDNTNPPWEGRCPAGYQREVFCGAGTGVTCGQAACGPTTTTPTSTCSDGIQNGNETGIDCGGSCPNACPPNTPTPPNLTDFSGASCYSTPYTASLTWSGTPLPSADGGCANGYWVDISTSSSFSSYSNKCVQGTSTSAPDGFGGPGGGFSFQAGQTYYARVFNGFHSNTASLTVPNPACGTPDTGSPTCNSLTLSPTHGPAGTIVTITGSTQDNVKVTTMEFFQNPTSLATFNNGLNQNPFTQSYNFDTTGKTQGSYTIVVNAVDAAGNLMRGLENTCNKPYTVDPPPPQPVWVPATCSANTFSGCSLQGQARCTDFGQPGYTTADGTASCSVSWTLSNTTSPSMV